MTTSANFISRRDSLNTRAMEACIPLYVTFEITLRCNLRCVHCYNFDRDLAYHPQKERAHELTDEEINDILDELHQEGCLFLAFTGGEALAHPRIEDFIRHACRIGMAVRLKSNGVLLNKGRVQRIADAGASAVDISLYGADAPTHDAFVRQTGAFDRTIEGARAAHDRGLKVRFSLLLVQSNRDQIEGMIAIANQMGVPYSVDPQMAARYDGSRSSLDVRIDHESLQRIYRGPLRHLVSRPPNASDSVQCSCARAVCGISAFGEVYPCIGAPVPSGNLREHSFHDIWRNSPTLRWIRNLRLDDFPTCKSCVHRPYCRRSSGVIYTNTGVYTGPEKFGEDWVCGEAEIIHRMHDETAVHSQTTADRNRAS
jgi:radical SAM protein with 4Fe4S-binding SPASM domain